MSLSLVWGIAKVFGFGCGCLFKGLVVVFLFDRI